MRRSRIALDLTIAGDRMTLDFSRSSPPCDGPLNIARSTAIACCYVALKHIFTDVPANAGCLEPIEFNIPDTTLLAVSAPRPVAGYTETILRVIDVIFGAFAKAAPERAQGSPFATINALSLAGWREHGGAGSCSASSAAASAATRRATASITATTRSRPPPFRRWKSWNRSIRSCSRNGRCGRIPAGPGRNRGGLGAIYEVEALARSRRRRLPDRRARQVSAVRRQRRRAGGAEPLHL